ncbi:MAG: glycosyltransferase family 9 protein [Sphingobacteriaceae bacterium]|nr:glycosyltransferase family 9 protein [Cytophagaceae bacterium]
MNVALWLYRWRKATDILTTYLRFAGTYVWLISRKLGSPRRKVIGILLAEHFGDIVACEPLLRYVRSLHPHDRLYWIVRPPFRELVDFHPDLDGVILEKNVLFSALLYESGAFDRLYFPYLSTRLYAYTGRRLRNPLADRLGADTTNYFSFGNILEAFSQFAGLPALTGTPRLFIQPQHLTRVETLDLPKLFVVVHCHSNYAPKDWQAERWQRLVRDLIATFRLDVVEVGLQSTLSVDEPGYRNLCGMLGLLETAEVIRRAVAFVGVESGPAHLANAVGTYGYVLLGWLDAIHEYMPYSGAYQTGENARLIRNADGPCSELPYAAVWEPIWEGLKVRNGVEVR